MSDENDLERDIGVAEAVGRLPPPALPPGLADRIVRKAVSQPQSLEPAANSGPAARRRPRRWLAPAIGGAVAASFFAALLLLWGGPAAAPQGEPRPAEDTPLAPSPAAVARVEVHGPAVTVPHPDRPAATKARQASPPALADRRGTAQPRPRAEPPTVVLPEAQPAVAEADAAPSPSQQALVGPPEVNGVGSAMPQMGPPTGMGIVGPPAPVPGAGSTPAPRTAPRMPSF